MKNEMNGVENLLIFLNLIFFKYQVFTELGHSTAAKFPRFFLLISHLKFVPAGSWFHATQSVNFYLSDCSSTNYHFSFFVLPF
jgi:hypothetical protein